jgi:hypothetical protein
VSPLQVFCRCVPQSIHAGKSVFRAHIEDSILTGMQRDFKTLLTLHNEDPQALEMVIRYFYHLDYPSVTVAEEPKLNGFHEPPPSEQNETEGAIDTSSFNGNAIHQKEDTIGDALSEPTVEPMESLDEFLPIIPKPKNKKKKKKKSNSAAKAEQECPTTELPEVELVGTPPAIAWEGEEEVAAEPEPRAISPPAEEPLPHSNLTVHAKVYELSKQFGIDGLKALALEKFETEAGDLWETMDFLYAAREVYTSQFDKADRSMKDVITAIFCQHQELLDKEGTQEVIQDLQLPYDVLMRVHKQGGF